MRQSLGPITSHDVFYQDTIPRGHFRRLDLIRDALGRIRPEDIGKLCFEVSPGVAQCENDEQRERRLKPAD
jgi:hypothetical protein